MAKQTKTTKTTKTAEATSSIHPAETATSQPQPSQPESPKPAETLTNPTDEPGNHVGASVSTNDGPFDSDGTGGGDRDRPGTEPTGTVNDGGSVFPTDSADSGNEDPSGGIQLLAEPSSDGNDTGSTGTADTGDVPESDTASSDESAPAADPTPDTQPGTTQPERPLTWEEKVKRKAKLKLLSLQMESGFRALKALNEQKEAQEDRRKSSE
ncbi:hypothetical protein [Siphonobacter sp. SORGH_AS_0500]|uniref:hypothetical protein n=1 Tax=Siphonobacter sp. SORGH_AS_0500 TaxID=1864824 RepID=UPI00285C5F29|nr:hypothetical protein [Siphonobacter sp. SORGH_AS_0500]MDR6195183.1 hypothetical protein [Siphonobacter sp. SORGH_AS_0500]